MNLKFLTEIIERRSRLLGYAIEARKQRYPEEAFSYSPFLKSGKQFKWDQSSSKHYFNLDDLVFDLNIPCVVFR